MPPAQPSSGNPLRQRVGPLPLWGWGVAIGGGILAYYLYKRRQAGSSAGPPTYASAPPTAAPLDSSGGGGFGGGGQFLPGGLPLSSLYPPAGPVGDPAGTVAPSSTTGSTSTGMTGGGVPSAPVVSAAPPVAYTPMQLSAGNTTYSSVGGVLEPNPVISPSGQIGYLPSAGFPTQTEATAQAAGSPYTSALNGGPGLYNWSGNSFFGTLSQALAAGYPTTAPTSR